MGKRQPLVLLSVGVLAHLQLFFAELAAASPVSYSPTPLFGQERLDAWEVVNDGLPTSVRLAFTRAVEAAHS